MEYELARSEAKNYYRSIGSVFSPALQEEVHFSRPGFFHLLHKAGHDKRTKASQIKRFGVLPLAVEIVSISTTYQEFEEFSKPGTDKMGRYWGIIAILHSRKIKVVLRRIGESTALHFWSVIPDCITSPRRDEKLFESNK